MSYQANKYVLSREFAANNRQNLQFYLWTDRGYILHPSINIKAQSIKVAEIGVATGIWLLHLSRLLPTSAQIDGFDIDLSQCPPNEWLPSNVNVHILDCWAPIPDHLAEQYDIVHIQLFHLGIHNNDPIPVFRNLLRLLKPGGYISWGEYDYKGYEDSLTKLLDYQGTMANTKLNWTRDFWPARLPQIFSDHGLIDIVADCRLLEKDVICFQLDTALAACEEISYNALDPLGGQKGDVAREMVQKVFSDRQKTAFNVGRLTVVGRKPPKSA